MTAPAFTREEFRAVIQALLALADAIRELREVPAGHLYAHVASYMTADQFNRAVDLFIRAKVVERRNNVLYWVAGADHLTVTGVVTALKEDPTNDV